jgi:thiol-disulfide isomerase/thioredoxin
MARRSAYWIVAGLLALTAVFVAVIPHSRRADEKPALAAKPAPTADQLWTRLQELLVPSTAQPQSREEYVAILRSRFVAQQGAAEEFLQEFPNDPRRHGARVVVVQAATQLARVAGVEIPPAVAAERRQQLEAIIAAPDATDEVKGEASFVRVNLLANEIDAGKPDAVTTFLKAADQFLAEHASHRLAPQMRQLLFDVISGTQTPETEAALARLATGNDEALADAAGRLIAMRQRSNELRSKPIALKFTATNGTEVDLEKMRGKVVLVDFWASWCAPCLMELPHVVAAYQRLHDRGFEVIGISLDQDKDAMDEATKKLGMTWPQYFDGGGFAENRFAREFGINAIPDAWLIDKKGMLRGTRVSGESLAAEVEKLLAE